MRFVYPEGDVHDSGIRHHLDASFVRREVVNQMHGAEEHVPKALRMQINSSGLILGGLGLMALGLFSIFNAPENISFGEILKDTTLIGGGGLIAITNALRLKAAEMYINTTNNNTAQLKGQYGILAQRRAVTI